MLILLAALPIVAVVVLMMAFNRPAKEALPIGWVLTVLAALFVWKQNLLTAAAWATDGFLEAIGTFAIIAGAILIMNTMKASGAMSVIERMFMSITPDRRIQAVIIGFVFEAFLEGAAGFGTPAAIAAPLMIGLGFPPLCAAIIALIFNSVPVNFGVVGVPSKMAIDCTKDLAAAGGVGEAAWSHSISTWCAIGNSAAALFIVFAAIFVMCRMFGKQKRGADAFAALPFIVFTSIVFVAFYFPLAYFFGPEYPSLVGGVLTLAITCFAAKRGFLVPKQTWDFGGDEAKAEAKSAAPASAAPASADAAKPPRMGLFMAWLPYLLIIAVLAVSRMNLFGTMEMLKSDACSVGWNSVLGQAGINWKWNWGWCPGVVPFFLVCIITFFLHRIPLAKVGESFAVTWKQCLGAGIALFFGVSMVYLYRNTGMNAAYDQSMLNALARGLADIFKSAYAVVAPVIGVLGAFMSGSNTVSNTLFASLQYETALMVKLSPVLIVSLQNIGAAAGNMVCVNNVVAVCATTGTNGNEGKIIRTNMPICLGYCLIAFLILGTAAFLGVDPLGLLASAAAE